MIIGTVRPEEAKALSGSAGYHRLTNADGEYLGVTVEVFWDDADEPKWGGEPRNYDGEGQPVKPGWYWWACLPGCLPDGEPSGPFSSSHRALADAEAIEE